MATLQTSDSNFEKDVIGSNLPALVDFWAEWCGPCKQIGPILEKISDEKKDVVNIYKINIDNNPEIPQKYGVRGIPTLMFFNDGKLVDTKVGSLSKSSLNEWIENNLNI
jgi:thioredoxin 1